MGQSLPAPARSSRESPILPGVAGAVAGTVPGAAASSASMAAGVGGEVAITEVAVKGTAAILAVLKRLSVRRVTAMRLRMLAAGGQVNDVDAALAGEAKRERVYQALAERRVAAGMRLAVRASDASTRAAAIDKVIRREQIIAGQRAVAAAERVLASAELQELRRISPQGAFWLLGPRRTHTADCVAMAGHFWPWNVLSEVHPLLHVGCGCYLRSLGWAIANGYMTAGDIPSPAVAAQLAAPIIAHVRAEKADAAKRYDHLAEQATTELALRERLVGAVAIDDLAIVPLRADEALFTGIDPGAVEHPLAEALLLEADTEHKGAMVAFYPSAERAKKLAITGGSPPEQLHVTLAFLGPDASKLNFDQAKAAVTRWAAKTPAQSGELSGIGHFDVGGGEKVTYRSVDLPDIAPSREALVKSLSRAKVPATTNHGFTPHMTIDNKVRRVEVAKSPIAFDTVTLKWGDERHHFALAGS